MNNNWNYITLGIGIASIIIGLLRVFLWDIAFMDTIELFIIGLGMFAVFFSYKNTGKKE